MGVYRHSSRLIILMNKYLMESRQPLAGSRNHAHPPFATKTAQLANTFTRHGKVSTRLNGAPEVLADLWSLLSYPSIDAAQCPSLCPSSHSLESFEWSLGMFDHAAVSWCQELLPLVLLGWPCFHSSTLLPCFHSFSFLFKISILRTSLWTVTFVCVLFYY